MGRAGYALKQALETYGISQNRLAVSMGIDRAVISRWARELRDPTAQSIVEIQQALQRMLPEASRKFVEVFLGAEAGEILPEIPTATPQLVLKEPIAVYSQLTGSSQSEQTLGQKLKHRRESLGLTRIQVAEACDVVQSTVINWEIDRHKPKLYPVQMKALCDLLKFTLEELAAAE
jgi:transcriptional regulator with XRE-family HTH domain